MNEIDDTSVLGEKRSQTIEKGDRCGVNRIELQKPRLVHRKGRKIAPEGLVNFADLLLRRRPVTDQALGDQLFNVSTAQANSKVVAVFDLVKGVLMDLSCLFNPFLKRRNDPEGKGGGFFSEILNKSNILLIGMGIRFGSEKLRKFVDQ
jgi:hypothetical protein